MGEGAGQGGSSGGSSARKKYVLTEKSTVTKATVDKKTLRREGDPVELTEDEFTRLSDLDGVKLAEATA